MHIKKSYVIVLLLCCFIAMLFVPTTAGAATNFTVHNFPDETNLSSVKTRNTLNLSQTTLQSYEWHGVDGVTSLNSNEALRFTVPVDGNTKYTDLLDLYFENVGKTGDGRSLNAKIHIDSYTCVDVAGNDVTAERVCSVNKTAPNLIFYSNDTGIKVTYTTTITYADTGEILDMPMLQSVYDIDIVWKDYPEYNESIIFEDGYSGNIWTWDKFSETVTQNKIVASNGVNRTVTDDMWLYAGGVAPTKNGKITTTVVLGKTMENYFRISLANDLLDNPVKTSDGKDINLEGDTINYTITQKMGKLYGDTMTVFDSFIMTDTLPEGVTYKSAKVYDGDTDITSKGTLKYDSATHKVTFTMGSAWLNNIDNYNGQDIVMKIVTTVDKPASAKETLSNTAKTYIDGGTYTSNTVTDNVYIPYHVNYKYVSGTEDRELPKVISTTVGDYKISDNGTYYTGDTVARKAAPADGAVYEVYDNENNYVGRWTLSWDASKKTVESSDITFTGTWVYTPAPRLVIAKKIENDSEQFTEAHGEPTFLFKITGKDSGKVWYKSITFTEDMIESVQSGAKYTAEDGTQFKLSDGYIYAAAPAIYLPEDEYAVEELSTVRFDETSCTAQYHSENGAKSIGSSKTSITVPLKLSTYKQGSTGFGADYASVCFENEKTRWDKLTHTDIVINDLEAH